MYALSSLLDRWKSKNPSVAARGEVIGRLRERLAQGGIKSVRHISVSEDELTVVLGSAAEMALARYLTAGCLRDLALRLRLKIQ